MEPRLIRYRQKTVAEGFDARAARSLGNNRFYILFDGSGPVPALRTSTIEAQQYPDVGVHVVRDDGERPQQVIESGIFDSLFVQEG